MGDNYIKSDVMSTGFNPLSLIFRYISLYKSAVSLATDSTIFVNNRLANTRDISDACTGITGVASLETTLAMLAKAC